MLDSGHAGQSTALRCDVRFLNESEDLQVLLNVLEAFALHGRYHDLETATGNEPQSELQGLVSLIQSQFTKKRPEILEAVAASNDPSLSKFNSALLADLTETKQRFARALCRPYSFGLLGEIGLRTGPAVYKFLLQNDGDLKRLA